MSEDYLNLEKADEIIDYIFASGMLNKEEETAIRLYRISYRAALEEIKKLTEELADKETA